MKKIVFVIICILLICVLFILSAAALGEPWKISGAIPEGPYYQFSEPKGIATDADGNVYVSSWNRVKRYTPDGLLDTTWGGGDGIVGGETGPGDEEFDDPMGIAVDSMGRMYVADSFNDRVKRYTSSGLLDTSWGGDGSIGRAGGDPTEFQSPSAVAVDASGNVYVADRYNDRIVCYKDDGNLNMSWGGGDSRVTGFNDPEGVAALPSGVLYVSDTENHCITRLDAAGAVDTAWGNNGSIGSLGTADTHFNYPQGLSVDASGNLYVADNYNNRVKRYLENGTLDTSWGSGGIVGNGTAGDDALQFNKPCDVAADPSGNVYIADSDNDRIKRYTSDGALDTSWGNGGILSKYGNGSDQFRYLQRAVVDNDGNLYVSDSGNDRIKRYTRFMVLDTSWGNGGIVADGLDSPRGMAIDSAGRLYVADRNHDSVRRYKPDGNLDTSWGTDGSLYGSGMFDKPEGVAIDSDGRLYVADAKNNRVKRYLPDGTLDTGWLGDGIMDDPGEFNYPSDVAVDSSDRLYVVDNMNHRVKRYLANGTLDTGWGNGGIVGGTQGSEADLFSYPRAIMIDTEGNVYVADNSNDRIKRYSPDGTLDNDWFANGIWQSYETPAENDSPLSRPEGIAAYETRVYSVWDDRVLIMCDVEKQLKLTDLTANGSTVDGFDPETLEYTITVSKSATQVQIGADAQSVYAAVSGTGTKAFSGNSSQFDITVTAETGDTQVYKLNVLRSGENSIGLSDLSIDGETVSGFSESKTSYTVTMPYGREYLNIAATGNSYCEEITGTGIVRMTGSSTDFTVIAKAVDGSAKAYTLTVKKGSLTATTYDILLDGRILGISGLSITVPNDGSKTIILKIELSDGRVEEYPITIFAQGEDDDDPSSTPTPTSAPTTTRTAAPTQTEDVPDTGDGSPVAAPAPTEKVVITIVVGDLPEGAVSIKLPSGEVIELDGSDTIQIEVDKEDIGEDGSVEIIPLDEEGIPLGSFRTETAQATSATGGGMPGFIWLLIGIAGTATIGLALYLILSRKRTA